MSGTRPGPGSTTGNRTRTQHGPSCARPMLAPGIRLQWEPSQRAHVLLFPEGMVTLSDTAYEILRRCDGRDIDALVADLRAAYPDAEGLEDDVCEFLEIARDESWLDSR